MGEKRCVHFVNTSDSRRLDNEFLQHIGGINDNSFIKVLYPDIDKYNELNCPQIISLSSYCDSEKLSTILQTCKISSQFLVQTYSLLMQKLMN